ncbi:MAG: hypothetical protein AAGJ10_20920 [Bacteroidota bacterium]
MILPGVLKTKELGEMTARDTFHKGLLLLDRKSIERGEEFLRSAIALAAEEKDKATFAAASCCLGELLLQMGKQEEAAVFLQGVVSMDSQDGLCSYEIAKAGELLNQITGT